MDLQAEYATVVDYNAMLQTLRMASLNMQSQRRSVQQQQQPLRRSVMVVTQQHQPVVSARMATAAATQPIKQRTSARRPRVSESLQVRSVRDLQMPSWAAKVGLHSAIPAISSATYVLR